MKKKALFKNFYRTIFRTLPKFFSILFLIALGVMVFVGLKITSPIMRRSVEKRVKDGNLYHFKISSSFGLLKEDEEIIDTLENKKELEFGYAVDLQDKSGVDFHVENVPEKISTVKIVEGREIKENSDILLDERLRGIYKIGDRIYFENTEKQGIFKDEVKKLRNDIFYVVGFVESPEVITTTLRGTTENGYLALISKNVFNFTNFSYAKITFWDMYDLKMQSSEFDALKNRKKHELQELFKERPVEVYNLVYSEKRELLDSNKKELQENKSSLENSEKELEENQKKLENGTNDVRNAYANLNYRRNIFLNEINSNKDKLYSAKEKIRNEKAGLENRKTELVEKNKSLVENKEKIIANQNILNPSLEKANSELRLLEENHKNHFISDEEYNLKKEVLDKNIAKLETEISGLNKNLEEVEKGLSEISSGLKEIEKGKSQIESKEEEINKAIDELEYNYSTGIQKFDEYYEKLNKTKAEIEEGKLEIDSGKEKIEDAKGKIVDADKKVADGDEILSKLVDPIYEIEDGYSTSGASVVYFAANGIKGVSNVFSVFFYFIALLVALTTMTRTVDEDRVQIGTLKGLGYSNVDIAKKYFYYGFLASIIGGAIGTVLGFNIISPLVYRAYLKSFIFKKVFDSYYPLIVLFGILLAVICTSFVSYFACINSLKEKISLLMRPKPPKAGNKVLLENFTIFWKELSFLQKVTLRNVFRYKLRLSMTIIGVMGCMGLLVLGFGIKDSLDGVSALQYDKYTKYHLSVVYNPMDLEEKINKFTENIKNNKEIKDSVDVSMKSATIKSDIKFNEKVGIFTVFNMEEFSKFFGLYEKDEKIEELSDGIYINTKLAEKFSKKVSDELTFVTNNREYTYKIAGIFENHVGNFIIMNNRTHEKIFSKKPVKNTKLLILNSLEKEKANEITSEIEKEPVTVQVTDIEVFKTLVDEASSSVDAIILVIIICSGFLSIVVLYNLSNINISERKREIATLKVLGFYPNEIDNYIYKETFILTLIGIVLGVFVGNRLHINIMEKLAVDSIRFFNRIKLVSYIYSAMVTLLFTFIVYLVVKIILNKVKMIESLKDVE